jgi:iron complex transport system substrate-binding protein
MVMKVCGQRCGLRAKPCAAVRQGISPTSPRDPARSAPAAQVRKPTGIFSIFAIVVAIGASAGCDRRAGRDRGAAQDPAALRLITLTPSATEVVHALGATSQLVGVDEYSRFPAEVASLPRVGSFLAPDPEAILRLDPDLVITDDIHGDLVAALADAGVAAVTCAMHSFPDVKACLGRLGERLGRAAEARAAIAAIDGAIDDAAARRPARGPRVLAVIDREIGVLGTMVAAGPGSWIDQLLGVIGGRNVLATAGVRYPKIDPEDVLREQPDVILDASYVATPDRVGDWRAVDLVPAVRDGRVVVLREPYFTAPSPRIAQALGELEAALYRAKSEE